jgi:hypothetical protein
VQANIKNVVAVGTILQTWGLMPRTLNSAVDASATYLALVKIALLPNQSNVS